MRPNHGTTVYRLRHGPFWESSNDMYTYIQGDLMFLSRTLEFFFNVNWWFIISAWGLIWFLWIPQHMKILFLKTLCRFDGANWPRKHNWVDRSTEHLEMFQHPDEFTTNLLIFLLVSSEKKIPTIAKIISTVHLYHHIIIVTIIDHFDNIPFLPYLSNSLIRHLLLFQIK